MNKQARDNRLYVRSLLWKRNRKLAEELEWTKFTLDWDEFFSEFWPCSEGHHQVWPDAVVVGRGEDYEISGPIEEIPTSMRRVIGFGDCETDVPAHFGADEVQS